MEVMDNPGIYHPHVQDSLWPFVPAVGVLAAFGLIVLFAIVLIGSRERKKLRPVAAVVGIAAVLIGWASAIGVTASAADWESKDVADHEVYVSEVRQWLSVELEVDLSRKLVERLLTGRTITIHGETITLENDRPHDRLVIERG